MTTSSRRRLVRDYKAMMLDPPVGVIARPEKDDLMAWQAVIFGPDDTAWEGGSFKLQMMFSEEYPSKAPKVKFLTKLFHPNVYTDGAICIDILGNQWSPIYDVAAILTSIQSLLTDPNPNSPANVEAAKLYVENRREYDRKVAEVIEATWKLEEAEADSEGDDDEGEEEAAAAASTTTPGGDDAKEADEDGGDGSTPVEDADAAPRKKQKLTETTALPSNAKEAVSTAAASSSSAPSSSAASTAMQTDAPPAAASAAAAAR